MGEVYRADDLKLGQAVALKFLPPEMEKDEERLQRFLNEVRMALRVTHPNVTRVHDIGEEEGQHYISMEYVDGEDLASLLRRIGRLPEDKAIQVARQICAGLAAAHDQTVLHRDLKPANVMLDGRGQVKITDFGLAGLEATVEGVEARAGTPAYMAPEQLAGAEVTIQSDLYALGLVLYEVFTGQPVFAGKTPVEIAQIHREGGSTVTSPSTVIDGIDPAVERVIVRCMEARPEERPLSALAVSAALPGGDPLAAALAAGETPSPELVAQAGGSGGLNGSVAMGLLAGALVVLGCWLAVADQFQFVGHLQSEKSPDVLVDKARQIIRDAGYDEPPLDSLFDFAANSAYQNHLGSLGSKDRWSFLSNPQPAALRFRYRQSPSLISKFDLSRIGRWMEDPPVGFPGEVMVELDLEGRLLSFQGVPPERVGAPAAGAGGGGWESLLNAAGFEGSDLTPQAPEWVPPFYSDARAAWTGVYPDAPEVEVRIEAAAFQGRPVAMRVIEPWGTSRVKESAEQRRQQTAKTLFRFFAPFTILTIAVFVAWRNVRLGRGDRKTALRFAIYLGIVRLVWIVGAHVVPGQEVAGLMFSHLAHAAFRVFVVITLYLAVEPYARRLWPQVLVSWMRLVDGRLFDPLVGRDVLVGLVVGAAIPLIYWSRSAIFDRLVGLPSEMPFIAVSTFESLRGGRQLLAALAMAHTYAMILGSLLIVTFLVIMRLIFRRTWIAAVAVIALEYVATPSSSSSSVVNLLLVALVTLVGLWAFFRFGFLTFAVAKTFSSLLRAIPMTVDVSSWYFNGTLVVVILFLAMALYAFRVSLAGRSLFSGDNAAPQ